MNILRRIWGAINILIRSKGQSFGGFVINTTESEKDLRDYPVSSSVAENLPSFYTIPNRPPIRNQGRIGSCRAHSVVREYEVQLRSREDITYDGSELFHYFMTRKHINNTFPHDTGMSMRDGCKTALKYGIAPEALCPYRETDLNKEPNAWATGFAQWFRAKRYERVLTLDELKQSINEHIPVGIGIWVDKSFLSLNNSNYVWKPTRKGTLGGHAVTVVGYNDKDKRLIVENSWGTGWGKKGIFYIPYDKLDKNTFDWFRILL